MESPQDMDPSVQMFARPGDSTESLPASPLLSPTFKSSFNEAYVPERDGDSPQLLTPTARSLRGRPKSNSFHGGATSEPISTSSTSGPVKAKDFVSEEQTPKQGGGEHEPTATQDKSAAAAEDTTTSPTTPSPKKPGQKAEPKESKAANRLPRPRADSRASVATFNHGGAESIFRLLPRETRPAIRRMMFVEPTARATLTDLLQGKGRSNDLLCGCNSHDKDGAKCEDHIHEPEETDDGDEWLKSIACCSVPGVHATHCHVKMNIDEKAHKKRFF